jgi:hypothetical protein
VSLPQDPVAGARAIPQVGGHPITTSAKAAIHTTLTAISWDLPAGVMLEHGRAYLRLWLRLNCE